MVENTTFARRAAGKSEIVMANKSAHQNNSYETIGQKIKSFADLQSNHPALIATGYEPISYGQLQLLIDEVREGLRSAGHGPNARIAVALRSGPQAALAIVAVACCGTAVPLNPNLAFDEVDRSFSALQFDAVILDRAIDSNIRRVAERENLRIIESAASDKPNLYFNINAQGSRAAPLREADSNPPAFILQTSGTAAAPKLIPFSHGNMLAAAARLQTWFRLTTIDRCLSVSPLYYSHGLKVTVFAPLLTGGTVVFPSDALKFDLTEWFGNLKPTWYSAGPTLHHLIFDHVRYKAEVKGLHSLRFVLSGGAPLSQDVLTGLEAVLGVPVVEHYGSSEAAQICANLPPPGPHKAGTCGIPLPNTISIVSDDGRQVPPGERGEILVGGPTVISGYLNAPELNRECFVDGWYRSGDIGSIDESGFLILHGRKNDLINRGGEKISPSEVDAALMRHPAVAEAAAFSVPHGRLGEDIAAAVVLRPGMAVTSVELRKFLQEQVTPYKIPRRIEFRDHLPRGPTGKILRRRLSDLSTKKLVAKADLTTASKAGTVHLDTTLLKKLWEKILNIAPVSVDDDFFDKGGDSLLAVEMLTELEWITGYTIPSSILFEASTIRSLMKKLIEEGKLTVRSLVPMNSNGRQIPLVFFHGDYKGGYYAARVADLFGPEQPLLIVAPHGIGDEPIPNSIEAMASDRLSVILQAQPEGPYRLCGNCLGGIVAFEVARLLIAAGKKVEMVSMIDPPTINARKSVQTLLFVMRLARIFDRRLGERAIAWTWFKCATLQRMWKFSASERWEWAKVKLGKIVFGGTKRGSNEMTIEDRFKGEERESKVDVSLFRIFANEQVVKYAAAMANYFPEPIDVRVIYFAAEYGVGKWRRLSPHLEVINLPGNHYDYDLKFLVRQLKARLRTSV